MRRAASVGHVSTVRALISAGADVHANGVLDAAIEGESKDAILVLLRQFGASATSRPSESHMQKLLAIDDIF